MRDGLVRGTELAALALRAGVCDGLLSAYLGGTVFAAYGRGISRSPSSEFTKSTIEPPIAKTVIIICRGTVVVRARLALASSA